MNLFQKLREPLILMVDGMTKTDQEWGLTQFHSLRPSCLFLKSGDSFYPLTAPAVDRELQVEKNWKNVIKDLHLCPLNQAIPFELLRERALDVLSDEVTLVVWENQLYYLTRQDFLVSLTAGEVEQEAGWLRSLFTSIPRGLVIVDLDYAVVNSNGEAQRMLRMSGDELARQPMNHHLGNEGFFAVQRSQTSLLNQVLTLSHSQATLLVDFVPLLENQVLTGYALVLQDLPSVEAMAMELDSVRSLNEDLEAILAVMYDEIIVVDGNGVLLRASKHYLVAHWSKPPGEQLGQSVLTLLGKEDLLCEVIHKVQQTKRKVSLMRTEQALPLLIVATPVLSEKNMLDRIVIASRDLTEVAQLRRELESAKRQSETYWRELQELRDSLADSSGGALVYTSDAMHKVVQEAQRVAQFSTTVVLVGESGVGKEVIANAIHSLGSRRNEPMIKINCASIPEALLESELFGYVKGAFSGALPAGKEGLFVKAHGGTLFLDEISELSLGLQSKLLRAIQEREVYPVGSTNPVHFDVQLVAATNRPLLDLVKQGKFREDLYYRIHVFPINIPALRDRREDIAVLANHILHEFNQRYGRQLRFSAAALETLEAYDFPGNIRELQNIVYRLAILNDEQIIEGEQVEELVLGISGNLAKERLQHRFSEVMPLQQALQQVEKELVLLAMERYRSTTRAAKALGISQSSVSRKHRQYQAEMSPYL